jgi:hypothetical protein
MGRSDGQSDNGSGDNVAEPKHIEVYEHLAHLNQHCIAIGEILTLLGNRGAISKRESTYFRLLVEEVRASSSQSVMERLDEHEVKAAASASKRRLALEKKLFGS